MSPRQRRGVLLLSLAAVGAIGVFALVAGYVGDVRDEVDPKVPVLYLDQAVGAYSAVTPELVREEEVPERWLPDSALRDPSELTGLVAGADLEAGSLLQRGMLIPEPELEPGEREIAILVDAETGVLGKIGPGSVVDILATFPSESDEGGVSQIAVQGARVLEVGLPRQQEVQEGGGPTEAAPAGPARETDQVVPVTFGLTVRESLVLTHAESFAAEVRLALIRPGETSDVPRDEREFSGG